MSALVEVFDSTGRHYMHRSNPRRGRQLTPEERTAAVLRVVVDGEDTAAVGADIRISRATLGQWCSQWRRRVGQWRCDLLSAAERIRGCRLVEASNGKAIVEVGELPTGAELVQLQAQRDTEARVRFVELLEDPTAVEADLLRAWRNLAERDREILTPAWDAQRELAELLEAGRRRVREAIAAAEVAP